MSFGEGAAGLTLTAANHVFLLEPCSNAADEAQVMRAYKLQSLWTRPYISLWVIPVGNPCGQSLLQL